MEITANSILSKIMSAEEIADTHAKLATLGAEGSKALECATDFMKVATMANTFRFHKQENLFDYVSSTEQFLRQLKAVKEKHGFTNNRISSGIEWLKKHGFDFTYGRLDIDAIAKDAFAVFIDRETYYNRQRAMPKGGQVVTKEAIKEAVGQLDGHDGEE
jgi:hypothetical protein